MPDNAKILRRLSALEVPGLIDAAQRIAGFDLGKKPEFATAANVSGVRNRLQTFSQRRDSRTMFATDSRYGYLGKAGAWTGPDKPAIAACRQMIRAAGVPASEIGDIKVLSEYGAAGKRVGDKEVQVEKPELLRKLARAQRIIAGLPVWSSHAVVGLTRDGAIGVLELHWPFLAPDVLKEAHVLGDLVRRGFEPRPIPGAKVESIAAGIVHSPAVGFFMDAAAAIRVVYIGDKPERGRKPLMYYDRHGELIPRPRDIEAANPPDAARPGKQ